MEYGQEKVESVLVPVKQHSINTSNVQLRILERLSCWKILIEHTNDENRQRCEQYVVENYKSGVKDWIRTVVTVENVGEEQHSQQKVLIQEQQHRFRDAQVVVSSMFENQMSQVAELSHRELTHGRDRSSMAFRDSNANVGLQEHGTSGVAAGNSQDSWLETIAFLREPHQKCLLAWHHVTTDDGLRAEKCHHEYLS